MELSLQQAADLIGKSKSTVHRSVIKGKISANRRPDGSYGIETSELLRVFPAQRSDWDDLKQGATTLATQEASALALRAAVLEAKLEMMETQAQRDQETIADLRRRLDKADERVLALTGPTQQPDEPKWIWEKYLKR